MIRANLKGLRMLVWMYSAFITPVGAQALEQGIVGYFLGMPIRFDNWIGMSYAKDASADYSGNAINVDEDFDLTKCDILMCMRNCYRFWV